MSSYNKVILLGNLCRDPEIKYTAKGTAICRITLAVNRKWKSESGEEREEVSFIDCDSFGRSGETIAQYLSKGSPLLIEGRLKLEQWERDGEKRSKLGVVIESFQFVGGGKKKETESSSKQSDVPKTETADEKDDVPF